MFMDLVLWFQLFIVAAHLEVEVAAWWLSCVVVHKLKQGQGTSYETVGKGSRKAVISGKGDWVCMKKKICCISARLSANVVHLAAPAT